MRAHRAIRLSLAIVLLAAFPAHAEVRLSVHDGRVAVVAKDATVGEILAEWARVGELTVVNADRLPSTRITIQLQEVTEQDALDVLLRAMGGYIARRRAVAEPNASLIDCIVLMAQSAPVPVMAGTAPAPASLPGARPAAPLLQPVVAGTVASVAPPVEQQSAVVLESAPGDDVTDNEVPAPVVGVDAGTATAMERAQPSLRARRALETADPRDFKLPAFITGTRPGPIIQAAPRVTSPAKR